MSFRKKKCMNLINIHKSSTLCALSLRIVPVENRLTQVMLDKIFIFIFIAVPPMFEPYYYAKNIVFRISNSISLE